MDNKVIITLWRVQFLDFQPRQFISFSLTLGSQKKDTQRLGFDKNVVVKQTFIFTLSDLSQPLIVNMIKLQQDQKVIYAAQQQLGRISYAQGRMVFSQTAKGTVPCRMDLKHNDQKIGTFLMDYELLRSQVKYAVQAPMKYKGVLVLNNLKASFSAAHLSKRQRQFKLKYQVENRDAILHQVPFQAIDKVYVLNFPIRIYLQEQTRLVLQLVQESRSVLPAISDTRSISKSSRMSASSKSEASDGHIKCQYIFLNKKNFNLSQQLSLSEGLKEVGVLSFSAQWQLKQKSNKQQQPKQEQKERKKQLATNGDIIVNSVIIRLQLQNQALSLQNFRLQVELGKSYRSSQVLECPGKQLVFFQEFVFKRTWEENMEFKLICTNLQGKQLIALFSSIKLRQLFQTGRFIGKRETMQDLKGKFCGQILLDVSYVQRKYDPKSKKRQMLPSKQQLERMEKLRKKRDLMKRYQRLQKKPRQSYSIDLYQDIQPPAQNSKGPTAHQSISTDIPTAKRKLSYYGGGNIIIGKEKRFFQIGSAEPVSTRFYKMSSEFDQPRGISIGSGSKHDFTKVYESNPGVGRYRIPSIWDRFS